MTNVRAKVSSNGSLLIQSDGSVQLSGRVSGDPNQIVTYNTLTSVLESTDLTKLGIGGGSSDGSAVVTISRTPPPDPVTGQLWWNSVDGRMYIFYVDSTSAQWVDASPGGGAGGGSVVVSDTPPATPAQGDLWWNTIDGRLFVYYIDATSAQWVDASPNGGSGGAGAPVIVSNTPPPNATEGDLWWNELDGRLYIWYVDATSAQWVDTNPNGGSGGGGVNGSVVIISPTPPTNPVSGQLWWNSSDGRLFVYYIDATSEQWVDASPNGSGGGGGVTGSVVAVGDQPPSNPVDGQLWWNSVDARLFVYYIDATSEQWVDASPNGGTPGQVTTTTVSDTAPTNPSEGDLWWNTADGRLFIWYEDSTSDQWVDASPNGGGATQADVTALQQQIDALEARIAALEGN